MTFSHGDWGLPTKEHTSLNLGEFQTCASSLAQVLLLPNLPRRFGVFFPDPLACLPCWLEAQLLTQVCNCSQINHGPGYLWTAAGQHHCLAWLTRSHSGHCSSCCGDSQSQPGLHWQGVFHNQLALWRSVSCRANMGIREIQVDVLTSDVMGRAWSAAGLALVVQHQLEGIVQR